MRQNGCPAYKCVTMKLLKKLAVLFAFLFLISNVYAQDFDLFSGKFYELKEGEERIEFEAFNGTYNICGSEVRTIPIMVVNNDDSDNKFTLESFGAEWARLNVNEFSLPKKQRGVVFLKLAPGLDVGGKYAVKVSALSSANSRKDLVLDVNAEKCYSLKLELEKEYDKACGGVEKQYSGEITNDGKSKTDAKLSINGPNWISIDKNAFSIDVGNSEKFELNAEIPANAKGIFNVAISAIAKNTPSINSGKNLRLEIVSKYDCHKADIISDLRIRNDYSNVYVPIKIRNSGIEKAEYEISVEGPRWISVEPKRIAINPEQYGNVNLNINPDEKVAEGDYGAKINVKHDENVYSKNIDIILGKSQFLKSLKSFFSFYKYYIYIAAFFIVLLLIFRRQISNKIKKSYKDYKARRARLKALEAARKARQKKAKTIAKAELEVKKISQYRRRWILLIIGVILTTSILFFSTSQLDFPVSKEFVKKYYAYFIVGILISVIIIFLIEFYSRKK